MEKNKRLRNKMTDYIFKNISDLKISFKIYMSIGMVVDC